jgi:hypothetical protein
MIERPKPEHARTEASRRVRSSDSWVSDAKLRALTDMILAMPVGDRLRQIEANANFFLSVRPLDG